MTKLEFQAESVRIKNIIVILNIMVRNHNIISIGGMRDKTAFNLVVVCYSAYPTADQGDVENIEVPACCISHCKESDKSRVLVLAPHLVPLRLPSLHLQQRNSLRPHQQRWRLNQTELRPQFQVTTVRHGPRDPEGPPRQSFQHRSECPLLQNPQKNRTVI